MSTFAVCFNRFYDMPYIRIKAYPKDQATKEKVVEAINKVFVDNWGLYITKTYPSNDEKKA